MIKYHHMQLLSTVTVLRLQIISSGIQRKCGYCALPLLPILSYFLYLYLLQPLLKNMISLFTSVWNCIVLRNEVGYKQTNY